MVQFYWLLWSIPKLIGFKLKLNKKSGNMKSKSMRTYCSGWIKHRRTAVVILRDVDHIIICIRFSFNTYIGISSLTSCHNSFWLAHLEERIHVQRCLLNVLFLYIAFQCYSGLADRIMRVLRGDRLFFIYFDNTNSKFFQLDESCSFLSVMPENAE